MSVEIIAELATNHGGSLELAEDFIREFAGAGANTIKLQLTRVRHLSSNDPQYEWFRSVERPLGWYYEVVDLCVKHGVGCLLTAYHPDEVTDVHTLCNQIKVGSGEAHEGRLAGEITSRKWARIIVSEGIRPAHAAYDTFGATLLGCCSRYPAPHGMAAGILGSGTSNAARYTGWSDHAVGLDDCRMAVVLGAEILETHVQLPHQARPPKPWEKTVGEIAQLRQWADEKPERFLNRWQHG